MNKINKKALRAVAFIISALILLYLGLGLYLAGKTYKYYKKTENAEEYVNSYFINEKQYINLSPYGLQVFNSDGLIKENVTNISCNTRYFLIFPFVTIKEGQFVLHGSYSYSFSFDEDGESHSSASMGEVEIYYGFEGGYFYVVDLLYGV